jgi:serine/threonine protein kinase
LKEVSRIEGELRGKVSSEKSALFALTQRVTQELPRELFSNIFKGPAASAADIFFCNGKEGTIVYKQCHPNPPIDIRFCDPSGVLVEMIGYLKADGVPGVTRLLHARLQHGSVLASKYGGPDLFAFLCEENNENRRFPAKFYLDLAEQLLKTLDLLHQIPIVHGDIRPENVIVDEKELRFYLIDFDRSTTDLTRTAPETSISFRPPEEFLGARRGPQTDLWGLGVLLFQMYCKEKFVMLDDDNLQLSPLVLKALSCRIGNPPPTYPYHPYFHQQVYPDPLPWTISPLPLILEQSAKAAGDIDQNGVTSPEFCKFGALLANLLTYGFRWSARESLVALKVDCQFNYINYWKNYVHAVKHPLPVRTPAKSRKKLNCCTMLAA